MMELDMKWWILIAFLSVLVIVLFNRSLKKPLILIWYGVLYSLTGGIVLFLVNLVGQYFHFSIPINMITAFVAGLLGFPGVLYLVVVKLALIA